ncbi:hypothetical protein BU15DRAFT_44401 [Melanogaster broomeanus]|nr:hypothetical protein BU15DRAFT_44401 [Melanogaster broomeanus]
MAALPPQHELGPRLNNLPNVSDAYTMILHLEQSAQDDKQKLIHARTLGYLILEGPSDDRDWHGEVVYCRGDETALAEVGELYVQHYIRSCRLMHCFFTTGRTPLPSDHPSRRSFDTTRDVVSDRMTEAPSQHQIAKNKALPRDHFCCVITGVPDAASARHNQALRQMGILPRVTHCAHIFAESTNRNISDEGGSKHHYAASMWAIMTRFGYKDLPQELNGGNVHRLENILTLDLWFEPTDTPNKYNICWSDWTPPGVPTTVEFTTSDPEELPLPSPTYLHIHATCAKVAKLSGAGDYIDNLLKDLEEVKVLSKDGASAELLKHALLPFTPEIPVF